MSSKAPEELNPPPMPPVPPRDPDTQSSPQGVIQTYTGVMFDIFNVDQRRIDLKDIAHALAMTCRYGGHSRIFYSVAEHSVLMAEWFWEQHQYDLARWAVLHDASEAYMGDMVRPLKLRMPAYANVEKRLERAILTFFGMPPETPMAIKQADLRICNDERPALLHDRPWSPDIDRLDPLGVEIHGWSPALAEQVFTDTFWRLFG